MLNEVLFPTIRIVVCTILLYGRSTPLIFTTTIYYYCTKNLTVLTKILSSSALRMIGELPNRGSLSLLHLSKERALVRISATILSDLRCSSFILPS